jgi:dipeptidyl aminopeptidase/acylaminoacyl peptidase
MRTPCHLPLFLLLTVPIACGKSAPKKEAAPAASTIPYTPPPKRIDPARPGGPVDPSAGDPTAGWPFVDDRAPDNAADADKAPFGIDALYQLKSMSDPQWSPDGKQVLFTVSTHELSKGKSNTDIYVINADGENLRQLTRADASDAHPRWSPDGKSFLFVSSREGSAQVWVMPIDGGEPHAVTKISTGASDPAWSPDGTRIAFVSRVYPEHGADDAANAAEQKSRDDSTITAHIADHLLYRHWTFYADGTRNHILVTTVETGEVIDVTPGDFESPAFELGGPGFAWSPDGREICFVSNREEPDARAWSTNKDLWVVPAEGGETINITHRNPAYDGHPVYSPDGRYIAHLRQEVPGFEADRFRLALYDRDRGETKILTEGFDTWVLDFAWSPDSKKLTFSAPVQGRFPLFEVDPESAKIERVAGIPGVESFSVAPSGKLAFTYSAVGDPVELYIASRKPGDAKRVTSFNREVAAKYDARPVEEMWIPGANGKKVHTFIVKPHGFKEGKKYPLILNVHGGPQYQWADRFRGDWQVYPAAGYVVAFPNPHGSIGYGQEYTNGISKDWGGKVHEDVTAVTEALAGLPFVDSDRMGAMGWSYGGYYMNWLMGHTDRFKAIASMMGIYDLRSFYLSTEELWFPEWDLGGPSWENPEAYREFSPSTYAKNFKTPTLIITGEKDYRIPYTESLALFTALRRQNVPARLIVFPNDGHWPRWVNSMPLYYAAHLDWFHRYLGGEPSRYDPEMMVRGQARFGSPNVVER